MLSPLHTRESKDADDERGETTQTLGAGIEHNNVDNHRRSGSNEKDEIDRPPKNATVTRLDVLFLSLSIITHIANIGTDINLAVRYVIIKKINYFVWTIVVIFVPTLINTLISFRMNDNDLQLGMTNVQENGRTRRLRTATTVVSERKGCCILVVLLQLGPVLRYVDSLRYALNARRCERNRDFEGQRQYYLKMLKEDEDVALLRVLECFLESAPQQILQVTILLIGDHHDGTLELVHPILSISSSLVSMGWSMASYHRAIRLAQQDKSNINFVGTILQFLWHFCVTVSRIMAISVLASRSPLYIGLACLLHWAVMTTWLVAEPNGAVNFCRDVKNPPYTPLTMCERFRTALFAAVLGTVYIFTYLNPSEGRTLIRHLFYWGLCLMENIAATVIWAVWAHPVIKNRWYFELLITLCIVPFCLGISAMIVYYAFFHPTSKRKSRPEEPVPVSS